MSNLKMQSNNQKKKVHVGLLCALVFTAYSLPARSFEVSFEGDAKVKILSEKEFLQKKEGDKYSIPSGKAAVLIPKYGIPILLSAPDAGSETFIIKQEDMKEILDEKLAPHLQIAVSDIISEIKQIEVLIQKRSYAEASAKVGNLKSKYKSVSTILFLSGTLNYLMNSKAAARDDLQKGLALEPDNAAAKKLLAQIQGGT